MTPLLLVMGVIAIANGASMLDAGQRGSVIKVAAYVLIGVGAFLLTFYDLAVR